MMLDTFLPRYLARPDDGISAICRDMARDLGPRVFRRQSLALRDRPDQTETLRAARLPTLILNGAEDGLCPPARHDLMHALMPHARRVQIAGAGHLPVLEDPDATNEALCQWLT